MGVSLSNRESIERILMEYSRGLLGGSTFFVLSFRSPSSLLSFLFSRFSCLVSLVPFLFSRLTTRSLRQIYNVSKQTKRDLNRVLRTTRCCLVTSRDLQKTPSGRPFSSPKTLQTAVTSGADCDASCNGLLFCRPKGGSGPAPPIAPIVLSPAGGIAHAHPPEAATGTPLVACAWRLVYTVLTAPLVISPAG